MTRDEAARLLGVAPTARADEVRTAFRRLLLRHHPDVAGAAGTVETHQLIAAYRVLRVGEPLHRSGPAPAPPTTTTGVVGLTVEGDTIHVPLPPADAFFALLEVGHGLGEVAYIDRSVGLLEIIVVFDEFPVCSVVADVHRGRRAATATDVVVMVESLTGDPPPPAAGVAELIADRLLALFRPR